MRKLIGLVIVGAVLFHGQEGFAQSTLNSEHFYVFAGAGWGGYPNLSEGSEFSGVMGGVGAGVPIGLNLAIEGAVEQIHYRRHDWTGWEGNATAYLGRATYRFGRPVAPVRFLLSAAIGHAVDAWKYPPLPYWQNQSVDLYQERKDFAVWGLGGGAHIRVRSRMFVRPDVSFLVGESGAFYRSSVVAGVAF